MALAIRFDQLIRDGVVADHGLLYVEGQAFEDDAERLIQAANEGSLLDVLVVADQETSESVMQLKIVYVADQIDPDSRALRFYMDLPNERSHEEQQSGRLFVAWKYRPGQRMGACIPLGKPWQKQIDGPSALHAGEKCGKVLRQHLVKCRGLWLSHCIERLYILHSIAG
jgi:hypothetical protein